MSIEVGMKLPALAMVVHCCWPYDKDKEVPFLLDKNDLVLLLDISALKDALALGLKFMTENGEIRSCVWWLDPNRNFKLVQQ